MIKTLRKVWKSDWGKAALVGVGLVGYGAFSSDGHVAKKNNLDIICTLVKPQCSINDLMIILNTTQINWNIESFLNNGIVFHKNKNYVELREIWEDTGINLGALYEIYSFDLSRVQAKSNFEQGTWEMSTKSLGNKIVRYAEDINQYVEFSYKTNFIRGFAICVSKKGFKIKHLISQLKKFPNHIYDAGDSPKTSINMLNKIYNHCCLEEEQVFLGK